MGQRVTAEQRKKCTMGLLRLHTRVPFTYKNQVIWLEQNKRNLFDISISNKLDCNYLENLYLAFFFYPLGCLCINSAFSIVARSKQVSPFFFVRVGHPRLEYHVKRVAVISHVAKKKKKNNAPIWDTVSRGSRA